MKIYLETHGCQMNVADSERAASRLRGEGFDLTETAKNADVVILNTCSVREKAEQKVFHRINEIKRSETGHSPIFGIMGCVAQLEGETLFARDSSVRMIVGTGATDRLPEILKLISDDSSRMTDLGGRKDTETWEIDRVERHSRHIALVPIIEGCNKFCTYCIVPYSRGRERSRPALEIIRQVQQLLKDGYTEVQLIGQNVNSYRPKKEDGLESFSGATPFSRLLRAVASTGMPRIKFTTSFPRDFHADIVKAIEAHENLCNWIHLPVQSGSDRVLRAMRRGHKIADYSKSVEVIKNSRRRIALTSDIIVGFPGETLDDFEDTLKLVENSRFDGLYIFKYSVRGKTPAAKLDDSVSAVEKTRRFLALEETQMSIQREIYKAYIGTEVEVLVEGVSARSSDDLTGHTSSNKVINFRGRKGLIGKLVSVRVTEAKNHSLYGELSTES